MIRSLTLQELSRADAAEVSRQLEEEKVVFFPESPVPFPEAGDLDFLRNELPRHLRSKNISYHPESGRVAGIGGSRELRSRALQVLSEHNARVQKVLQGIIAPLAAGWTVATSSFRPLEEKGRALSVHASNERVHVDAGAYGATHGDRVLRFFMNANDTEERVWVTKGGFRDIYRRYGRAARIAPAADGPRPLAPSPADRLYTGLLRTISRLVPAARLAETSPYDRLMRRFHNYLKDTPEVQQSPEGHREFRFPPRSAWMVFTDGVSHACVRGRHAFIDTFIIPLANCRRPAWTPYHLLQSPPAEAELP